MAQSFEGQYIRAREQQRDTAWTDSMEEDLLGVGEMLLKCAKYILGEVQSFKSSAPDMEAATALSERASIAS